MKHVLCSPQSFTITLLLKSSVYALAYTAQRDYSIIHLPLTYDKHTPKVLRGIQANIFLSSNVLIESNLLFT